VDILYARPSNGLLYVPGGNPGLTLRPACAKAANLYNVRLSFSTPKLEIIGPITDRPKDWHDWDVSGAPALIKTAAGKTLCLSSPKDAIFMVSTFNSAMLYREPVTKVENATSNL